MLFKLPGMWHYVMAALSNEYTGCEVKKRPSKYFLIFKRIISTMYALKNKIHNFLLKLAEDSELLNLHKGLPG